MSYYKKITNYVLTNHANRRIRERVDLSNLEDYKIYDFIEKAIEQSILSERFENGDIKLVNYEEKLAFVLKGNLIKTVINLDKRNKNFMSKQYKKYIY